MLGGKILKSGHSRLEVRKDVFVESPHFDMFGSNYIDYSNAKYEMIEIQEDNGSNIALDESRPNLFLRTKDVSDLVLPSDSYLEVRFQLRRDAATAYGAADYVVPKCDAFQIWKSMEYLIDGRVVDKVDFPGIASVIMNIVEGSSDSLDKTQYLWYKEKGTTDGTVANAIQGTLANMCPVLAVANGLHPQNISYSEGLYKKWLRTNTSKEVTCFLPIAHLFKAFDWNRKCLIGMRHEIRLVQNSVALSKVFTQAAADGDIFLTYVSWWLPHVKPTLETEAIIQQRLAANDVVHFKWEGISMYNYSVQNLPNVNWRISSLHSRPTHVFIALSDDAKDTNKTKNLSTFDTKELKRAQLRFNHQQVPLLEYEFDFTKEQYARAYNALIAYSNRQYGETSPALSMEEYKTSYPIIAFDLSRLDPSLLPPNGIADLELRLITATAQTYTIYALVMSEKDMIFSGVDSTRLTVVN